MCQNDMCRTTLFGWQTRLRISGISCVWVHLRCFCESHDDGHGWPVPERQACHHALKLSCNAIWDHAVVLPLMLLGRFRLKLWSLSLWCWARTTKSISCTWRQQLKYQRKPVESRCCVSATSIGSLTLSHELLYSDCTLLCQHEIFDKKSRTDRPSTTTSFAPTSNALNPAKWPEYADPQFVLWYS